MIVGLLYLASLSVAQAAAAEEPLKLPEHYDDSEPGVVGPYPEVIFGAKVKAFCEYTRAQGIDRIGCDGELQAKYAPEVIEAMEQDKSPTYTGGPEGVYELVGGKVSGPEPYVGPAGPYAIPGIDVADTEARKPRLKRVTYDCQTSTCNGTSGADYITGEAFGQTFNLFDGDDHGYGDGGPDTMFGNEGRDEVDGMAGNDDVRGGPGSDEHSGHSANPGTPQVIGGTGNDVVYGGDSSDDAIGEGGQDYIFGEEGNDQVNGNDFAGGDNIYGGGRSDQCYWDSGDFVSGTCFP